MADIKQQIDYELKLTGVDDANRQMQGLTQQSDSASTNMGGLSDQFALGAIKANIYMEAIKLAGQAVQAYTQFLKESIQAAIEDQAETRKFLAVFKEFAPEVTAALTDLSISAGYSMDSLQNSASALQDFLVPMGVAREQASGMSVDMLKLAADLAAFNGVPIEDVLGAMKSGLAGMSRPMLQYGVDIRAAAVDQELLNMGISGGAQAATAAEAAQARLNIMMNNSADASGAAAKSMGSMDGMMRSLEGRYKDFQEEIGAKFIPVLEAMMPAFENILAILQPLIEYSAEATVEFLEMASPEIIEWLTNFVYISAEVIKVLIDIGKWVTEVGNSYKELPLAVRLLINPLGEAAIAANDFVGEMREMDEAIDEQNEAYRRQDESLRQAIISQQYFNDELDVSPRKAMALIEELESMELQTGASQDMIEQLRGELRALSEAELDAAIATAEVRIQHMQWAAEMTGGGFISSAIQVSIGQVQDYITQLQSLKAGLGTTTTTTTTTTQRSTGSAPAAPTTPSYTPQQSDAEFQAWAEAEMQRIITLGAEQGAAQAYSFQEAYAAAMADAQPILDAEHEVWLSRYNLAMDFSRDIANTFVQSWDGGFEDLDKMFKNMLDKWMKDLVASGILSAFSTAFGGGAVGTFGKVFGALF